MLHGVTEAEQIELLEKRIARLEDTNKTLHVENILVHQQNAKLRDLVEKSFQEGQEADCWAGSDAFYVLEHLGCLADMPECKLLDNDCEAVKELVEQAFHEGVLLGRPTSNQFNWDYSKAKTALDSLVNTG